jgi:hypothetical protein
MSCDPEEVARVMERKRKQLEPSLQLADADATRKQKSGGAREGVVKLEDFLGIRGLKIVNDDERRHPFQEQC